MQKKEFVRPLVQGQELEDIPEDFDSREVLIGRAKPSPFFVIKDKDQVLPYCVINFTRGLSPGRPAPLMSPSPAASSSGGNSAPTTSQSIQMQLQNVYTGMQGANGKWQISTHTNSSVGQPTAGPSFAGASALPTSTTMTIPMPTPYLTRTFPPGVFPPFFGPLSAGSSLPPCWPPKVVHFLTGKHSAISYTATDGLRVTLKDNLALLAMRNNLNFQQRAKVVTNVHKVIKLQIEVITEVNSKPDLIANERLKTIFHMLQQSDRVIGLPTEVISKAEAELKKLLFK